MKRQVATSTNVMGAMGVFADELLTSGLRAVRCPARFLWRLTIVFLKCWARSIDDRKFNDVFGRSPGTVASEKFSCETPGTVALERIVFCEAVGTAASENNIVFCWC